MTAKEAIKLIFKGNTMIMDTYLADLSDADLLVRPVPGANHAAWQLGHLIKAECELLKDVNSAPSAQLPAGFADKYTKDTTKNDSAADFLKKAEYQALMAKVREASLAKLDKLSDADLDKPNKGNLAQFAPTLGALFVLTANHVMMHGGQIAVLRRKLGKPIVI
jgi:hypothetical protein